MNRLDSDDWIRMNSFLLKLYGSPDAPSILKALQDGVPDLVQCECAVEYGHQAVEVSRPDQVTVGPFIVTVGDLLDCRVKQIVQIIGEHIEVVWRKVAPLDGIARELETNSRLTRRQREVLPLLLQGGSNAEIAETLGISPRTVEKHISAIFRLFHSRDRKDLFKALRLREEGREC